MRLVPIAFVLLFATAVQPAQMEDLAEEIAHYEADVAGKRMIDDDGIARIREAKKEFKQLAYDEAKSKNALPVDSLGDVGYHRVRTGHLKEGIEEAKAVLRAQDSKPPTAKLTQSRINHVLVKGRAKAQLKANRADLRFSSDITGIPHNLSPSPPSSPEPQPPPPQSRPPRKVTKRKPRKTSQPQSRSRTSPPLSQAQPRPRPITLSPSPPPSTERGGSQSRTQTRPPFKVTKRPREPTKPSLPQSRSETNPPLSQTRPGSPPRDPPPIWQPPQPFTPQSHSGTNPQNTGFNHPPYFTGGAPPTLLHPGTMTPTAHLSPPPQFYAPSQASYNFGTIPLNTNFDQHRLGPPLPQFHATQAQPPSASGGSATFWTQDRPGVQSWTSSNPYAQHPPPSHVGTIPPHYQPPLHPPVGETAPLSPTLPGSRSPQRYSPNSALQMLFPDYYEGKEGET